MKKDPACEPGLFISDNDYVTLNLDMASTSLAILSSRSSASVPCSMLSGNSMTFGSLAGGNSLARSRAGTSPSLSLSNLNNPMPLIVARRPFTIL